MVFFAGGGKLFIFGVVKKTGFLIIFEGIPWTFQR